MVIKPLLATAVATLPQLPDIVPIVSVPVLVLVTLPQFPEATLPILILVEPLLPMLPRLPAVMFPIVTVPEVLADFVKPKAPLVASILPIVMFAETFGRRVTLAEGLILPILILPLPLMFAVITTLPVILPMVELPDLFELFRSIPAQVPPIVPIFNMPPLL